MENQSTKNSLLLHIGQAGVQMGVKLWEVIGREHSIDQDGRIANADADAHNDDAMRHDAVYDESEGHKFVPRCVIIDTEPSVVEQVRIGEHRNLFHPSSYICGKEDAASNYAIGYYRMSRLLLHQIVDRIRNQTEPMASLNNIVVMHSACGGTGSGLAARVVEEITSTYPKIPMVMISHLPSRHYSSLTVEPYNTVLMTHTLLEHTDLVVPVDNQSLYEICRTQMATDNPSMSSVNKIIADITSSITLTMRYNTQLRHDFNEFLTNIVPFPRIHYAIPCHAPLICREHISYEIDSPKQLVRLLFDQSHQPIGCDLTAGRYMACSLLHRGSFVPSQIYDAVNAVKTERAVRWVDWCPTGFKFSVVRQSENLISENSECCIKNSFTMLANNTCVKQIFERVHAKFKMLRSKCSFLHWYVNEGMEQCEFDTAAETTIALKRDYDELEHDVETHSQTVQTQTTKVANKASTKRKDVLIANVENEYTLPLSNQSNYHSVQRVSRSEKYKATVQMVRDESQQLKSQTLGDITMVGTSSDNNIHINDFSNNVPAVSLSVIASSSEYTDSGIGMSRSTMSTTHDSLVNSIHTQLSDYESAENIQLSETNNSATIFSTILQTIT